MYQTWCLISESVACYSRTILSETLVCVYAVFICTVKQCRLQQCRYSVEPHFCCLSFHPTPTRDYFTSYSTQILLSALTKNVLCLSLHFFSSFRLSFTKGHFPKLAECAHFHYENVDFGSIQVRCSVCRSWSTVSRFGFNARANGALVCFFRDSWLPMNWKAVTDIINMPHKRAIMLSSSCSFFLFVLWWRFGLLV